MKIRVATPCSENLDAMPRTADGAYQCGKCQRDVVDLRRATRKRALAVIGALRAQGDGSVCARLNVRSDGTPVFVPEPSVLARFVGPVALAGSLAACSAQSVEHVTTTPVAISETVSDTSGSNANGTPGTQTTPVAARPPVTPSQNVNVSYPDVTPMAGGLAFSD